MTDRFTIAAMIAMLAMTASCPSILADDGPSLGELLGSADRTRALELAEQLGSRQFAKRERAATELIEMGPSVVETLRQAIEETDDPELKIRAAEVVTQMTEGNEKERIDRFLQGQDVDFKGWVPYRREMGDSPTVRQVFIELTQSHPQLLEALEGTSRERALAMEGVEGRVQRRQFVERQFPTRADTIALFLPITDPKVPLKPGYESLLVNVLDKLEAQKIRRDPQLAPVFRSLLGQWVIRSTPPMRRETLFKAMQWDVSEGLPLAIQTISETQNEETLVVALQSIARFGSLEDQDLVLPMLDDTRQAGDPIYANGRLFKTQVCDVAIAALAVLHQTPLKDFGFDDAQTHPMYGFLADEIGFPVTDPDLRTQAIKKIKQQIKSANPPEGS